MLGVCTQIFRKYTTFILINHKFLAKNRSFLLIISELTFRKRFGNLMRGVDLRKMEFLGFRKVQIISILKNIERMAIVDFSQEFTRKETKLSFAKNFQFCKIGKKGLLVTKSAI